LAYLFAEASSFIPAEETVMIKRPLISVIDDDDSVRESLPGLLKVFGFEVKTYASAEDFLAAADLDRVHCLILDIGLPGMSGPDLHRELGLRQQEIPIIFITGEQDENLRSHMLECGAMECLFKPVDDEVLHQALNMALGV
jgi:FixJ family two-component response regulator